MKPGNRSIVEKADIAVSNLASGGYLNPEQANTFIRLVINQPTIVNDLRVVPMNAPKMQINRIGFGTRILRKAPATGTALSATDRSAPTTDQVNLMTEEVIAEVHIPYDVLEDNIERGNLEDTIMSMIAERASLDIEELVILGDTTNEGDTFLGLMEGILAGASSHVVNFSSPVAVTRAVFKAGTLAMPPKFMRNRAALRFYVSPASEIAYADTLANRWSILGDQKTTEWVPNVAFGIPVVPAALMPDTNFILTYPKNIIMGVQRQIMVETDRDIRARVLIVVLTMRLALAYETEDAVVKCVGLNPQLTTSSTIGG